MWSSCDLAVRQSRFAADAIPCRFRKPRPSWPACRTRPAAGAAAACSQDKGYQATVPGRIIYSAIRGATPIQLAILLYDSVIEDMRVPWRPCRPADCVQPGQPCLDAGAGHAGKHFECGGSAAKQVRRSCWRRRCAAPPMLLRQQDPVTCRRCGIAGAGGGAL